MKDVEHLPKFKYHPNLYKGDMVTFEKGVCNCCGNEVDAYIKRIYALEDTNCICLNCVADGKAAEKYKGTFIQDAEAVSDPEKEEILFKRTPGYISWQGEYWLAVIYLGACTVGDITYG